VNAPEDFTSDILLGGGNFLLSTVSLLMEVVLSLPDNYTFNKLYDI